MVVLRLLTQVVALCSVGPASIARMSVWPQIRAILLKILLYLGPALVLLFVWLGTPSTSQASVNNSSSTTDWSTMLPRCINGTRVSEPCTTLLYSPASVEAVELVMRRLAIQNELEFGFDVVGTTMNETELQQYVLSHPNTTQGAIYFTSATSIERPDEWHRELGSPDIRYNVFYNSSEVYMVKRMLPIDSDEPTNQVLLMQLAVDRALASLLAEESINHSEYASSSHRNTRAVPISMAIRLKSQSSSFSFSIMGMLGPQLLATASYLGVVLWFVALAMRMANEKDSGLRGYLTVMGLLDSAWWIAAVITSWLPYLIGSATVMAVGQLVSVPLFSKCEPSVVIVVFVVSGISHFGLYALVGSIIDSKRASLLVSVGIYVFELLIAWTMFMLGPIALTFSTGTLVIGIFMPGFIPALLFDAVAVQTMSSNFALNSGVLPPGVTWGSVKSNPVAYYQSLGIQNPDAVLSILTLLLMNLGMGVCFFLLALYLDNVLERRDRAAQPWLYFLSPSYWGCGSRGTAATAATSSASSLEMRDPDPDIDAEIAQAHDSSSEQSLRVVGVSHTYRRNVLVTWLASWSFMRRIFSSLRRGETRALTDLHLSASSGSILCLLGANGSAKSTTVRIISGALAPTSGNVFVNGLSVRDSASTIQQSLGVCPQFDVLWPDLCARDHITLLGLIKLGRFVPRQQAMDLLARVGLSKVANRPTWQFSGGMKRSLSVALCTLGDPKVLLLDEPTSGMDPKTRRHLWNFILSIKHERLILLTTHSMEEADALGEKIAILRTGSLRCVGTPQHLKARFGNGYQLTVHAQEYAAPSVIYQVQQHVPGATLASAHGGTLTFRLPQQELARFSGLFAHLKRAATGRGAEIIRWGISNATLETVFLNVVQ